MIATRYYMDTNPVGAVSIAAFMTTVFLMGAVSDEVGLPKRLKSALSLQLPILFMIGGIICTPTKFVGGENIMGKIIFYVFVITCSIDISGCESLLKKAYGIVGGMVGTVALGNIFYEMIVEERFYHITAKSSVGISGLAVLLLIGIPIQILHWRSPPKCARCIQSVKGQEREL